MAAGRRTRVAMAAALAAAAVTFLIPPDAGAVTLPAIRHVFVINLENEGFATSFGPNSSAPYLAKTLPAEGELLTAYYGIAHNSAPNYIAEISGQSPSADTQGDCQFYQDVLPGTPLPGGQVVATAGCVYPAAVKTVADQLSAKGLTWKGYMEDIGNDPAGPSTCRHPALNSADTTQSAKPGDAYAARHDPFVYFHSIIDSPACAANVVGLPQLTTDLASEATTPNFALITPNLCNDGHDATCAGGKPAGFAGINAWLTAWVPKILAAPAYHDSLVVVTFDEASLSDATACCGEPVGPNTPLPGISGPGGGRVGAVLLSPFVRSGSTNATPYNHYALLRSVEDLFALDPLGDAAGVAGFGPDVYNLVAAIATPTTATPTTATPTTATPTTAPTTGGTKLPVTGRPADMAVLGAAMAAAAAILAARRRRRSS